MNRNFSFALPHDLIAQSPYPNPSKARLLVVVRKERKLVHEHFSDLIHYLRQDDLLILNNSACIPARFWGILEGGGQVEVTLVVKRGKRLWEAVVRPGFGLKKGRKVYAHKNALAGELLKKTSYGGWLVRFRYKSKKSFEEYLESFASVNIPFYIKKEISLRDYQNVYAKVPGSTQCPTAGLHLTKKLLQVFQSKRINIAFITVHIGGSSLPLTTKELNRTQVYEERFELSERTKTKIEKAKVSGGRVIAVGTSVVRGLESAADERGGLKAQKRWKLHAVKPNF